MTEEDPPETNERTKELQHTPRRPDLRQAIVSSRNAMRNMMKRTFSLLNAHQAAESRPQPQQQHKTWLKESQERLSDVHVDVAPRMSTLNTMKNMGCCSATLGELREELRNGRDPLERFHTFLWSPNLREFTHVCGIELDRFELPVHLFIKPCGSSGCDHVPRRLEEILLDEDENTRLHDSRRLAMVFHGSHTSNITSILENGLDPSRRTGQALGQGEYFAVDPGLCVAYCRGGKEIIVFLVLVPEENQGQDNDPAARISSFQHLRIIVVKDNEHQFPIGVLRFKSYSREARSLSDQLQRRISVAQTELIRREHERNQALIKAQIIQSLIQDESDIAAEKYEKFQKQLSEACKREISMYVHERLDADVAPFIFPNLPPPYSASEFQNAETKRVEWHTKKALKAKTELGRTKAKFMEHWEQETKRIKGTTTTSNISMTNDGDIKCNITPLSLASLPEPMKSSIDKNANAVASLSGRFLDVNEHFCKISGMDTKELRYKSIYHLTDTSDLGVIREILSAPMKKNCGGGDDGQTIWLLRGRFEHREDVIQMSVTLIKDKTTTDAPDISKCFAVKLIPNSSSSCPKPVQVTLDQGAKRKCDVVEQCRLQNTVHLHGSCNWESSENQSLGAANISSNVSGGSGPKNNESLGTNLSNILHFGRSRHIEQKRQRLLLLHHAAKCPCKEELPCPVTPHCATVKRLWRHMEGCKNNQCSVPHCFTSRAVLSHYRKCNDSTCHTCGPVREKVREWRSTHGCSSDAQDKDNSQSSE